VLTQPDDLDEDLIRDALHDGWQFETTSLRYQAVGFGSHHWLAANGADDRLFVTIDDLAAKLSTAGDTTSAVFRRLTRAFQTAQSLQRDAGLVYVVAPVPDVHGLVLRRLTDRYSLVVHEYLAGAVAGDNGEFASDADRLAVIGLLTQIHGARAAAPLADNFLLPNVDELKSALHQTTESWQAGPYGALARDVLAEHSRGVEVLLAAYRDLVARVATRPERMVITHGEPDAGNVLRTPSGFAFVDWEAALLAHPERDLWNLAEQTPAVLDAYSAATGVVIDADALALYRMHYDLAEIAGYIRYFRAPHAECEDAAGSWENLQYFLRPAERWPGLFD
jgi:aminoglycoside phosphotransferase (APT) family kinase protein